MDLDTRELSLKWSAKYPDCDPRSELLKFAYKNRWIRLHSLPNSKRYPENESEYQAILERHYVLLEELKPGNSLLVITSEWTDTPDPVGEQRWPKRSEIEPDAAYWQTIQEEVSQTYRQVYVSKKPWRPGTLDELLRAVANDDVAGVIIAPEDFPWLYHPYDGGADVILPSQEGRDALKKRHSGWLSTQPDGL
jgi:hypothetical protein